MLQTCLSHIGNLINSWQKYWVLQKTTEPAFQPRNWCHSWRQRGHINSTYYTELYASATGFIDWASEKGHACSPLSQLGSICHRNLGQTPLLWNQTSGTGWWLGLWPTHARSRPSPYKSETHHQVTKIQCEYKYHLIAVTAYLNKGNRHLSSATR
jgi:hypothetical protein